MPEPWCFDFRSAKSHIRVPEDLVLVLILWSLKKGWVWGSGARGGVDAGVTVAGHLCFDRAPNRIEGYLSLHQMLRVGLIRFEIKYQLWFEINSSGFH